MARVATDLHVETPDGAYREVDGVNRPPDVVRSASSEDPGGLRAVGDAVLLLPE